MGYLKIEFTKYKCVHVYFLVCVSTCLCISACMYRYIPTCLPTYVCVYLCVLEHVCMCLCVCLSLSCVCVYVCFSVEVTGHFVNSMNANVNGEKLKISQVT